MRLGLGAALALALATCGDGDASIEGQPCHDAPDACDDADTLQVCSEGAWRLDSCEVECAAEGSSSRGCLEREGDDTCDCDPSATCEPGPIDQCISSGQQSYCFADGPGPIDCFQLCPADAPVTTGCYYDSATKTESCGCVALDAPCDAEISVPHCKSKEELARCTAGAWEIVDCDVECGGGGADCVHDALTDAGFCRC